MANSTSGSRRQPFHIFPQNSNASNTFAYTRGTPTVQFALPDSTLLIEPGSLRLNYTIKGSNLTGDNLAKVRIDPNTGCASLWDQITLSSYRSRQNLEQIQHYNKLVGGVIRPLHDDDDFLAAIQTEQGSTNLNGCTNTGVITKMFDAAGYDLSQQLYSGLLSSGVPIPLSSEYGIGGLIIQLNLVSDSQFFMMLDADGGSPTYEISDVSLTGVFYDPSPAEEAILRKGGAGGFSYNSYSSLFGVVNAQTSQQTFNLGLDGVISSFLVMSPSTFQNNYLQMGNQPLRLTDNVGNGQIITRLSWTKDGRLHPNEFVLTQDQSPQEQNGALMNLQYLDSLRRFKDITSCSINNTTQMPQLQQTLDSAFQGGDYNNLSYGVGIAMDRISEAGENYVRSPWGMVVQALGLTGANQNNLYLFVLHRSVIHYGGKGIAIED